MEGRTTASGRRFAGSERPPERAGGRDAAASRPPAVVLAPGGRGARPPGAVDHSVLAASTTGASGISPFGEPANVSCSAGPSPSVSTRMISPELISP